MGIIRYKIWRDLWENKGRTAQVVLIIAMGAFAIGAIIGSSSLMRVAMTNLWQASSPSMINLTADPPVDDETIQALKSFREVTQVEGFLETTIEWRLSPAEEWQPAGLIARDDYNDQKFAKLTLVSGEWPQDRIFAVERNSDTIFGIEPGREIEIKVDDRVHQVKIGGEIYNPTGQPPGFGGNAQFYTSRDRFGELTGDRNFNRILAGAAEFQEETVTNLADKMQRRLEKLNVETGEFFPGRVSNPEKHFFQDFIDGIYLVLGVMAGLALILGLFLVYNIINAVVAQQVSQIGIMKAIGARTRQVLRIYLTIVLAYGLLALLIALPLGAIGAYQLNLFLLNAFNAQSPPFTISTAAILACSTEKSVSRFANPSSNSPQASW